MTKAKFPYYSFGPIMSRNALFSGVVGGRGLGKTYGMKKFAIRDYIRRGRMFVYLRRYYTELAMKSTFFDDIQHEFPDYEFRVMGSEAQMRRLEVTEFEDDGTPIEPSWETIGLFMALTGGQAKKGGSYPMIHTVIFDEFIIEKGMMRYLPEETTVLQNLVVSLDRFQDRVRVFMLANSVSITNPYMLEWNIRPDEETGEWITRRDGAVVFHFPDDALFTKAVLGTRFGRFIAGSDYADYAIGNQFADNHKYLVASMPPRARYIFTLQTATGTFSVWNDSVFGEFFLRRKRPKNENLFVSDPSLMREGAKLMLPNSDYVKLMHQAYSQGSMFFDDPVTRNAFLETFKR